MKKKSLVEKYPELAKEWHPTKNGELTPHDVTAGSGKKVWWQCSKGHEWQNYVDKRSRGRGCPYCSGRKVWIGFNDLATTHPELAKEWHPTKNGELTPYDVTAGSGKEIWWKCKECNYEWQAKIYHRASGSGCSKCWKEKQTSFSEQAILYYLKKVTVAKSRWTELGKEIDVYLPELHVGIEHGDKKWHPDEDKDIEKVHFFKEKGIRIIRVYSGGEIQKNRVSGDVVEYVYRASNRASLNRAIENIFTLLQVPAPVIDADADELEINSQYIFSKKEKSLAEEYPELAKEWHPTKNEKLTPQQVTYGSEKNVWWKCSKGHEWQNVVYRRFRGDGCPYCSGRIAIHGETDLATISPELAKEWHPTKNGKLTPQDVTYKSDKKVWWKCSKGHEWQEKIVNRSNGRGCPYCSGHRVWIGFNDLATISPELAKEWHPTKNGELTPHDVTAGSGKKVWWKCKECNYEWQAKIYHRASGSGCSKCWKEKRKQRKEKP